jgi:hypothetical protein
MERGRPCTDRRLALDRLFHEQKKGNLADIIQLGETMTGLVSLSVLAAILAVGSLAAAQPQPPKPAVPIEPISAIVPQFKSHAVVALGDNEASVQGSEFRIKLVRDPRLVGAVNDIVVEFGNSRYQDLIDRFTRGEEVLPDSLRHVWQDTTQVEFTWDLPIYEQFFQAVRDVNSSLPGSRKLRVLLGDPPIEWEKIHALDDLKPWLNRDSFAAEVVRREVLARDRRALIIYGDQHLVRPATTAAPDMVGGIVAQLERSGTSVFTIHTETRQDLSALQPDVASWPEPSLALLRDTTLGAAMTGSRYPSRIADQFDAVLYLGPPGEMTLSKLSRALCDDHTYLEMRLARLALIPPPPSAAVSPTQMLKEYCQHPEGPVELANSDPGTTQMVRDTLTDAARGEADPDRFAPESRERLVTFLRTNGPRFLAPNGPLRTLIALDAPGGKNNQRRYRASFANGRKLIINVKLSPAHRLLAIDARPE